MRPTFVVNRCQKNSSKNLEWILIIWSSVLLGIWAIKDTIALRNIMLVSGTMFSIYYIVQEWRGGRLKEQCTFWKVLPIILVALTFVWVFVHYLLLSQYPVEQLRELQSTWLRSLLAAILGFGSAVVIASKPQRAYSLLVGLFIPFFIVFLEWLIPENNLLHANFHRFSHESIFGPKPNALITGIPLFAWICTLFLQKRNVIKAQRSILNPYPELSLLMVAVIILLNYSVIIKSRIGFAICIFILIITTVIYFRRYGFSKIHKAKISRTLIALIFIIGTLILMQFMRDPLWKNLIEDFSISVQTDKYQNWRNLAIYQYPKRDNGESVSWNVYERVAWATLGIEQIWHNPLGGGVLNSALGKVMDRIQPRFERVDGVFPQSSHSAWIEIALAFGLPMLVFLWAIIFLNCLNLRLRNCKYSELILLMSSALFLLYSVAEISTQHGIESLYYWLTLMVGLQFCGTSYQADENLELRRSNHAF